jgi:hypothetical protein
MTRPSKDPEWERAVDDFNKMTKGKIVMPPYPPMTSSTPEPKKPPFNLSDIGIGISIGFILTELVHMLVNAGIIK